MLTFEQVKAIEKALGVEAAMPIIEAFQTSDQRVMSALLGEVTTKADLAQLRGEIRERFAHLETLVKVLIGLAVVAVGMFSPLASSLVGVLK